MTTTSPLAKTKRLAQLLLISSALLYIVAQYGQTYHPAWAYVGAFAEASTVGAVADWFAVTALFRYPLGLHIPHTAIIPKNKNRIGEKLAEFIGQHFLTTEQLLAQLQGAQLSTRLGQWLTQPEQAHQVAQHLSAFLRQAMGSLEHGATPDEFLPALSKRLENIDAARGAAWALRLLGDGANTELLNAFLSHLLGAFDNELIKEKMTNAIAQEVKYLRLIGLDTLAGRYAAEKMVNAAIKLGTEVAQNNTHPLRLQLTSLLATWAQRLEHDEPLRDQFKTAQQKLLAQPAVQAQLQNGWQQLLRWLQNDLTTANTSLLQPKLIGALDHLGQKLATQPATQQWFDHQLSTLLQTAITPLRRLVTTYIASAVCQWNTTNLTDRIEKSIGRDLQFIRINGTLVGGLIGLLLYSLTQFFKAL